MRNILGGISLLLALGCFVAALWLGALEESERPWPASYPVFASWIFVGLFLGLALSGRRPPLRAHRSTQEAPAEKASIEGPGHGSDLR